MYQVNQEPIVELTLVSGYTARQIINLIDTLLGEIPITFYRDRFEIKHAKILDDKTGNKVVVHFTPIMNFILKYEVNKAFFDANEKLVMTPPNRNFVMHVASTGRKDGLEMICYANRPETLFVNVLKSNKSGLGNTHFTNVNYTKYQIECTSGFDSRKPNVKATLNDIYILFSGIDKSRAQYKDVILEGYTNGMSIGTGNFTEVSHLGSTWGDCGPNEKKIGTFKLNGEFIKALAGLNNITEAGVVPFFFDPNILRFKIPIGSYGEVLIILENGKEEAEEVDDDSYEGDVEVFDLDKEDDGYWSS